MLARRVGSLPEGPGWSFEVKWDGYRIEAIKSGTQVRLLSRNRADYTARFAPVPQAVAKLPAHSAVLDGEVVAVDPGGRPSFQAPKAGLRPAARLAAPYYLFLIGSF
jgi:bifunctional non-homologous end joining protein LigD